MFKVKSLSSFVRRLHRQLDTRDRRNLDERYQFNEYEIFVRVRVRDFCQLPQPGRLTYWSIQSFSRENFRIT